MEITDCKKLVVGVCVDARSFGSFAEFTAPVGNVAEGCRSPAQSVQLVGRDAVEPSPWLGANGQSCMTDAGSMVAV